MKSQDRAVIKALPENELKVQLKECEEKLFKLRFAHAASPLKNGLQLRNLKVQRARILTWLREKQNVT